MGYQMRLNQDVDGFRLTTDEEGDIVMRCPREGCTGTRAYLFGLPDLGTLIGDAYRHLDEKHGEG